MKIMHYTAIFATTFLITACAKPTTYVPKVGAEERAAERQVQAGLAKDASGAPLNINPQQAAARLQQVYSTLAQPAAQVCAEIHGVSPNQCVYPVELSAREEVNAYADGQKVYVTPAMVAFASNDNELALVLAHEIAHNIMNHPQSQAQNVTLGGLAGAAVDMLAASRGYDTGGTFGDVGAQFAMMRYSAAFEAEADYVALYILARAGYDYANAPEFWRRMAARNPDGIYTSSSHPSYPERFVSMQKTVAEINQKKASGAALLPNIRA